jgi:hypothetical protein
MEWWPPARRVAPTARRERWNIGFEKDVNHFYFIVNPAGGGTINPTLHYPRTHYSTIPAFQHSNWGEALSSYLLPFQYNTGPKKAITFINLNPER